MATDMSDTTNVTEQAKRLHFAETLLHVSRTVSAMETLDDVLGGAHRDDRPRDRFRPRDLVPQ